MHSAPETLRDAGPYVAQHVNAGSDPNGNPRRGWIVYAAVGNYAHVVAFLEEGDTRRFRTHYGPLAESGISLRVPVREYSRMRREWGLIF